MIVCFPTPYPDELLYSVFARYYARTGYLAYIYAAEDLYVKRTTRPDAEFINELTADALRCVTKDKSIERVIIEHTMFPYYGRFIKADRRKKAFEALAAMKGNHHNLLVIPNRGIGYLRYCPLCASEDRSIYGETYWHRMHQMVGVDICPVHSCELKNSNMAISSKQSPCLITAEEEVKMPENIYISENELERDLCRYIMSVFQMDVDMSCNVNVGTFLHSRLANTKYVSVRGEQRNIELLHADFCKYYMDLGHNPLSEAWQIEKVFSHGRFNTYEICMISMFLNIPPQDFVNMKLPLKSQQQLFDEEIIRLHNMGLKYPEIARRLNAPYDTVKAIGEGRY